MSREVEFENELRNLVLFHTALLAVLTLLINGTTIGFVINKLGLARSSYVQDKMLQQVLKFVIDDSEEHLHSMQESPHLDEADWMRVRKRAGITTLM